MGTGQQTPAEFFEGSPSGLAIFGAVARAVDAIGPAEVRVSKSQIAFWNRRGFAYVWRPDRYLKSELPAVLSIALRREVASARFKQVAHPAPRVWMHHLEIREPGQIDDEVIGWLREAHESAT